MKRISSQTTFLYQIVWPVFSSIMLIVLCIYSFSHSGLIILCVIYALVYVWITPMFAKLKNVWIENDYLLYTDFSGKRNSIHKSEIAEISQNASMITPRLVKIKFKSTSMTSPIRFIPSGGYWIFWQHKIVGELNMWLE